MSEAHSGQSGGLRFEAGMALRYLMGARGHGTFSILTILALLGNLVGVAALVAGQALMRGIEERASETLVIEQPHLWLRPGAEGPAEGAAGDAGETLGLSATDLSEFLPAGITLRAPPPRGMVFDDALLGNLSDLAAESGLYGARPTIELEAFAQFGREFELFGLRGASLAGLGDVGARVPAALSDTAEPALLLWVPQATFWRQGLQIGQELRLITTQFESTPAGRFPLAQTFTLAGPIAGAEMVMRLADAQAMMGMDGRVSQVALRSRTPFDLGAEVAALEAQTAADGQGPLSIQTWDQRREGTAAFIGVLRMMLVLVLGLIILVSAFNIFSGQLMLTNAQRQAIAVMRTFGAGRGVVVRVFFMSGFFIALAGALVGLALGVGIALLFPQLSALGLQGLAFFTGSPPILHLGDMALAMAISLTMAALASYFPARAAASISPVEAFRYG